MALVAGVDIGAGTAKAVILANGKILSYSVMPTGYDSLETAKKTIGEALKRTNFLFGDLQQIVSTVVFGKYLRLAEIIIVLLSNCANIAEANNRERTTCLRIKRQTTAG